VRRERRIGRACAGDDQREGIGVRDPYRAKPIPTVASRRPLLELTVVANFVEVYLAKEGHDGPVGINLLEKIQLPNLASFYGAMLAGVDYVLMGAGIPVEIPGALDRLAHHEPARLKLHVAGATTGDEFASEFNPHRFTSAPLPLLRRPAFLAIIASATLALTLVKRATGSVDGFVVEGPTAGGHNAPPRGALQLNERGEPVYGPRDEVHLAKIAALGRPFWPAGSYGTPERVREALALGAAGCRSARPSPSAASRGSPTN
jgi:nitronate monooxygenase